MPVLQAPLLYSDEIAYIGCDWWGLVVTVDLTSEFLNPSNIFKKNHSITNEKKQKQKQSKN